MKRQVDLMLDSGAFSAWKNRGEISVNKYRRFVEKHHDYIDLVVNLDVLPGKFGGGHPTTKQVDASAQQGWDNLKVLRKTGLPIMPVYHIGERRYWLEKMIGEGFKYVGLGGLAKRAPESRRAWLDEVFTYLCGQAGYPTVKVHGFAVTSPPLMYRYPWYSVDSTTWIAIASSGGILVPQFKGDEPDYAVPPNKVGVSRRRPVRHDANHHDHFDSFGTRIQEKITWYCQSEGFEMSGLSKHHYWRARQCVRFFKRLQDKWAPHPFKVKRCGLSVQGGQLEHSSSEAPKLHIYFAGCVGGRKYNDQLQLERVRTRLVSYFDLTHIGRTDVRAFVKTGYLDGTKPEEEQ